MTVDKTGVEETGVDETVVDETEADELCINPIFCPLLPSLAWPDPHLTTQN